MANPRRVALEERVIRREERTVVTLYELISKEYKMAYDIYICWEEEVRTRTRGLYASANAAKKAKEKILKEYRAQGYEPYGTTPDHLQCLHHEVELRIDRCEVNANDIATDSRGRRYHDGERIRG